MRKLLKAEKENPIASVIYGGPIDTYIAAINDGTIEAYKPNNSEYLIHPYIDENYFWSGIYIGAIGFVTNNDRNR